MKSLLDAAIQWNVPKGEKNIPLDTTDCEDHPAVRPTTYLEIARLLRTSGCSKKHPWWVWSVMGVIVMEHGQLVVCPGDWIIEITDNHYIVINNEEYMELAAKYS